MATYYVQITSAWQGSRWWTVFKTDNKAMAEYMADGLEIEDNQFSQGNPGMSGRRPSRCISRTKLQREDGLPAISRAESDIIDGWPDIEAPTKRLGRDTSDRVPNKSFVHINVMYEMDALEEAFREEQKEKESEGKIDFLIRDMPSPLHAQIKEKADAASQTMTEWIIEACRSKSAI